MLTPQLQDQLKNNGYCVIPQVLSPQEVEKGHELFKIWFEANGPIEIPTHGVFKFHEAGHTALAWFVRTRPFVRHVFESLWSTQDLITSFDGFCYMPADLNRRNSNWLHVDQPPNDPAHRCVQALVSFTDNKSFLVAQKSHLLFEKYMASHELSHGKAWQKVPELYDQAIQVKVKAGDMILWDSRTAHQNLYTHEPRLAQYVCMLPRSRASPLQLKKRRKYFEEKRTTSHWPTPIRVNSLQPQVYGNASKLIDYSKLIRTDQALLQVLENEINKLI